MKAMTIKKIIVSFLLLTHFFGYASASHQSYTYVIKVDSEPTDSVTIKCTYKGYVFDLCDGIDFLPETELVTTFPILITAEHPNLSSGTVQHYERNSQIDCLWYDASWTKEGTKTLWTIKQRSESEMPLRIPHNALIICYPPEFVQKLEDKTAQESSLIIHLPTIVLKNNLTPEERTKRNDGLTRCILAQLDMNACLGPTPRTLVKKGNTFKNVRTKS